MERPRGASAGAGPDTVARQTLGLEGSRAGGRTDQGERLDFWLIMQGPVTLWLFGTYLGLVWEQMSWDKSRVGRRWLWPRGIESNLEGSDLP